jgi:hypothetical protein
MDSQFDVAGGMIAFNQEMLERFEDGINPLNPMLSRIPATVLGYGEMSTVMEIAAGSPDLVYKRMPMFHNEGELALYLALYATYQKHLAAAGITAVPAAVTCVNPAGDNPVVYIIQEKLHGDSLAHRMIHTLPPGDVVRLFGAILAGIGRVFIYNDAHQGQAAIGFDAQMSNWAVAEYDWQNGRLPDDIHLIYVDTSSPLLRLEGVEQLDPELFLRSAPSFLRWVIRLLFLDEVMNRYYDPRQVVIDVLANLYKEKRVDVITELVAEANEFLAGLAGSEPAEPVTAAEVAGYYREDARIWRFYLGARRIDRGLHRVLGRPYPYVLPGRIER